MQFDVTRYHGDFAVIMSFKPVKLIKVTMPHWIGQSLKTISVCIDQRKKYTLLHFQEVRKLSP